MTGERIYRAIGESIDFGVWICGPDGRNTYASDSFLRLTGMTQQQCSGFGWMDALHPDDSEATIRAWRECVRTGSPCDFQHRFRGVDGEWRPVLTRGAPVRDEQGRILGWAGVHLDVGAHRHVEESLRESERRAREWASELQAVMDAAPALILIGHDAKCARITGNRLAAKILGQPRGGNLSLTAPGEQTARTYRILIDGAEAVPTELPMQQAAGTGQPLHNRELRIAYDDGRFVDLLGNAEPIFDENGRPRGAISVYSDITQRKQAEDDLRESEERFRAVADTAPVMIWLSGPDKLCTFFNKPWLDFTGRGMETELGNGWTAGVHPNDFDRCLDTYAAAFDARSAFRMEYRLRRADGEYRWILDTGVPRYRGREFAGYIGSCVDITDQKVIEERLRAGQALLKDAQRLASVGSSEIDLAAGRVHWSDEMYRILGIPIGAPVELGALLTYVHPKDRRIVLDTRDQALTSVAPVQAEFRIVRPDGEVRFVRSVFEGVRDDGGAVVRVVGATQDITSQILASEYLRASEQRLKNAERIAHIGNWHWDIRTGSVFWSEELFRILGRTEESCQPGYRQFFKTVAPEDRPRVGHWVNGCFAGQIADRLDFQIVRPDGERRTVSCVIEVTRDDAGAPTAVSGACQDVTEARRSQQAALARQKLETVGTLASGIAHDFNNMLGSVLAQAELAMSELESESRAAGPLEKIRDVARQGASIVRLLMVYTGSESESVERVDVSGIVTEILELLKGSISRDAVLQTDLAADAPAVRGSAAQIRQIVMNLVVNASEAMADRPGVICVSSAGRNVSGAAARSAGVAEGEYLELQVSDEGCGMPAEVQARIFDPFFSTKGLGRGLGLAVVDGVVRKMGGAISLSSQSEKGSTVRVLLPAAEAAAEVAAAPVPGVAAPAAGWPVTVLLVDDEDALRDAVARMLRKARFDVLEAATGSAGIDLIRGRPDIDAVLLDVSLPGASSQEVVSAASAARPEMKIILTSAYGEDMARQMVHGPVVRAFIRKPFRLDELIQTLRQTLNA